MGTKIKTYQIRQDDLNQIIKTAVDTGIAAYKKEDSREQGRLVNRNLHNTRKLMESYRTLKNDLQNSDYDSEDAQKELRFQCVEDLMQPGETKMDKVMAKEIERLQENAWRKRHIERALELLKEDCSRSRLDEDMRKYRVLVATYIDDVQLSQEELAEQENVSDRTIRQDVRKALEMITPYLFSIEDIINRP